MKSKKQQERQHEIEMAAFEILSQKGYRATSMLAIAKHASASNQTLYKWYGNKQNLFRSIIKKNTREILALLNRAIETHADPLLTIKRLGPLLLRFITSREAIIINRAAIADADDTGILGETINKSAREAIKPLVEQVVKRAGKEKQLSFDSSTEAAEVYINLLFGALQIRQAMGQLDPLNEKEISHRSDQAYRLFLKLFETDHQNR